MSKKLGIIDLGSNSVRLVIFEIWPNGAFKLIDDINDIIRLSENMIDNRYLNDISMRKALKTVKLYKKLCNSYNILPSNIIAVATAAVRKAENRDHFLTLLHNSTGLNFKLLTGEEESGYIYSAVVHSIDINEGIIVDIGGGSTEIIKFKNRKISNVACIPLGSVVASENIKDSKIIEPDKLISLENRIRNALSSFDWLAKEKNLTMICLGGTMRNLARIHKKQTKYPLNRTHNYEMNISGFYDVYNDLKSKDLESRKKVKGISTARADIIVGGLTIMHVLLSLASPSHILISGYGLREGILYEYLFKNKKIRRFSDVLDLSLDNFMKLYGIRLNHANHVCHLALLIFDQLKPLHGLDDNAKRLLRVASLLHDIGISVSFYDHFRHSFYIILNSRLNGLTHREILIISAVASSHSTDVYDEDWKLPFKKLLSKDDIDIYKKLSVFLRISECLDRSEIGMVKALECQILSDIVGIQTIREGDAELELNLANENNIFFKKLFKKTLLIT